MKRIQITTKGVKSALRSYNEYQAIAEYVWNGFDAGASTINITTEANELGAIEKIIVSDNGSGIPRNELNKKFLPFYESEKAIEYGTNRNNSNTHGKNGVGRLTFFKFATQANWKTIYKDVKHSKTYSINVLENSLEGFTPSNEKVTNTKTGTTITFLGIKNLLTDNIKINLVDFIMREFCWFLELNKNKKYKITINNKKLDYSELIGDQETKTINHKESDTNFIITYIRWNDKINNEYSKYYYLNSNHKEQWKENTKLNNKGDSFYHSLLIESQYFNNFNFKSTKESGQAELIDGNKSDEEFKYLHNHLNTYLRRKRKPFLKVCSERLISEYIQEKIIFPQEDLSNWERVRQDELTTTIKGIYQIQPKIFYTLNTEQKKTIVGLLSLIIDSDDKDKILAILQEIVDLDKEERNELWNILQTSKLSSIIKTIKMIHKRQTVIEHLKELVFNPNLNANEVDHIQTIIEENYWLFGEQYNLVTSAEPDFEEALRRHIHLLTGKDEKVKIDDPDKNKEMDIFICRQSFTSSHENIENIVVELKHPKVTLGKKELDQVETYMRTIKNEPRFNNNNSTWTFILIGNKFTQDQTQSFIIERMEPLKVHGKRSLALYSPSRGYEVYVKTWSEILTEIEIKHEYLTKKLKMKRDKLKPDKNANADDIVKNAINASNYVN